jgi:hypothetical protein
LNKSTADDNCPIAIEVSFGLVPSEPTWKEDVNGITELT